MQVSELDPMVQYLFYLYVKLFVSVYNKTYCLFVQGGKGEEEAGPGGF